MFGTFELSISQPVNQQIYYELRRAIITCKILPGSQLSEKEISSQFNVSRQPVREAFIKLAEAGLVQILPQRGTFVTKITAKRVKDAQFIREAVECAIVEKLVLVATSDDIELLETNIIQQAAAIDNNNSELFLAKDDEFHHVMMQMIHCELAWEVIENIKSMMDRVRFLSFETATPPQVLIKQHKKIFEAIKKGDAKQAAEAQREHLRAILASIIIIAEQKKELFID